MTINRVCNELGNKLGLDRALSLQELGKLLGGFSYHRPHQRKHTETFRDQENTEKIVTRAE